MEIIDQVIAIQIGNTGFLDDLPLAEVGHFESGALQYIKRSHRDFYDELSTARDLSADSKKRLRFILTEYKETEYRKQRRERRKVAQSAT